MIDPILRDLCRAAYEGDAVAQQAFEDRLEELGYGAARDWHYHHTRPKEGGSMHWEPCGFKGCDLTLIVLSGDEDHLAREQARCWVVMVPKEVYEPALPVETVP